MAPLAVALSKEENRMAQTTLNNPTGEQLITIGNLVQQLGLPTFVKVLGLEVGFHKLTETLHEVVKTEGQDLSLCAYAMQESGKREDSKAIYEEAADLNVLAYKLSFALEEDLAIDGSDFQDIVEANDPFSLGQIISAMLGHYGITPTLDALIKSFSGLSQHYQEIAKQTIGSTRTMPESKELVTDHYQKKANRLGTLAKGITSIKVIYQDNKNGLLAELKAELEKEEKQCLSQN